MPSTTRYKRGEIVLVSFPFTDLSSSKRRPALVVSPDIFNGRGDDIVLAAITSQQPDDETVALDANDFTEGGESMPTNALGIDDHTLAGFCRRHHIRRLSLFGSSLRGMARPDSDLDLLVEFETGREPGLLGLAQMEIELSSSIGGRRIDLRTLQDLSRHFRDEVSRTALVQYAA